MNSDVSKDKLPLKHAVISSKLTEKEHLPKKMSFEGKRIANDNRIVKARKRGDKVFHAYTLSPDEK